MRIDYSKSEFTQEERRYMRSEAERLRETNPNHIPVLIQIDSNILKMEKQKFLVSDEINVSDFINNTLKRRIINMYNNDVIVIKVLMSGGVYKEMKLCNKRMRELYDEYKDEETNVLILQVSRMTTYKWAKSYINYLLGSK